MKTSVEIEDALDSWGHVYCFVGYGKRIHIVNPSVDVHATLCGIDSEGMLFFGLGMVGNNLSSVGYCSKCEKIFFKGRG